MSQTHLPLPGILADARYFLPKSHTGSICARLIAGGPTANSRPQDDSLNLPESGRVNFGSSVYSIPANASTASKTRFKASDRPAGSNHSRKV